jgi:hypothetical protein
MRFPPIKAGRCLLWITLHADDTTVARYAALRAVLKQCHLHPVDTTSAAEIVIVDEVAFRAFQDEVQAALGSGDMLHLVTTTGARLVVEVIGAPDVLADSPVNRPPGRRPVWLRNMHDQQETHDQ